MNKRGFTLVELLIVIAIIGVLSGILMGTMGGASDSALSAKCMANLKSLATGANSIAMDTGYYPFAGSCQHAVITGKKAKYVEERGWISWLSEGKFGNGPDSAVTGIGIASFDMDPGSREARFAVTNGTMYTAIGSNQKCYVCPAHAKEWQRKYKGKHEPLYSYVMSGYFGYDYSRGKRGVGYGLRRKNGSISSPDRVIMFAELPLTDPETGDSAKDFSEDKKDCTLQFKADINGKSYGSQWEGEPESIGFNHTVGKKYREAHVVFADGHVEKFTYGAKGLSLTDLTALLCSGRDVSFNGDGYEDLSEVK